LSLMKDMDVFTFIFVYLNFWLVSSCEINMNCSFLCCMGRVHFPGLRGYKSEKPKA